MYGKTRGVAHNSRFPGILDLVSVILTLITFAAPSMATAGATRSTATAPLVSTTGLCRAAMTTTFEQNLKQDDLFLHKLYSGINLRISLYIS
jgi:hypothetical protein